MTSSLIAGIPKRKGVGNQQPRIYLKLKIMENTCECGQTTQDKCPSYYCKGCCMPPHNCLCGHDDE